MTQAESAAAKVPAITLGATVGDLLDKPFGSGGLEVSRLLASAILAGTIALLILFLPQKPGSHGQSAAR